MKKKTIPLLLLSAAVPAAASLALTETIMSIAVDREQPKSLQALMKILEGRKSSDDDPFAVFVPHAKELAALPHETVELTAQDGVKLVGHWFEKKDARRVILAVHGWRSVWNRDFCMISKFWEANDCSVLYIEQRGQGKSGGRYIGFGLLESPDLTEWLNWLVARCGANAPIYLAGISMGASTVLMAADQPLPGNVRGIMADCGFTSAEDIWEHVARQNLHLPYLSMRYFARLLCKKRLGLLPNEVSTLKALQHSRYPVLLIHGEDDSFVPPSMTLANYAACSAPKRMLLVPGAIHGMSYVVEQDKYEAMEQAFWKDFDA